MSEMSRTDVAAPQRAVAACRRVEFDDFYVAELPRLVALARGLCPATVAEDVAQEAMLVAYRRWREVVRARAARPVGTPDLREPRGLAVPSPDGRAAGHRPPGRPAAATGASSASRRGVLGGGTVPPAPPGPGRRPALRLRHADRRDRHDPRHQRGHGQAAPQPRPPRPGGRPRRHDQEESDDRPRHPGPRRDPGAAGAVAPDTTSWYADLRRTRTRRTTAS